ncbi:hypothetical protein ENLAB_11230 [Enterococcus innesii]|uniref:Uncharacterized protein n=1 Tax=Enterococcus innesii TaxID=2839759 RepID=A0ABN6NRM4_9ENTE|nr:hypothetical protein ENLAB_11230 [Enterococcus innesii]
MTVDMIDERLTRMELRLDELDKEVEVTKRLSPNPAKQQWRTLKSQVRKLNTTREKLLEHQTQFSIYSKFVIFRAKILIKNSYRNLVYSVLSKRFWHSNCNHVTLSAL